MKQIIETVLLIIIIFLVGVSLLYVFFSKPSNHSFHVFYIQSSSMEPAIPKNSLVFTKAEKDYSSGDKISYKHQREKRVVTHMVVKKIQKNGNLYYITKGVANQEVDKELVMEDQVLGSVFVVIPYVGIVANYASTKEGFLLLLVIPGFFIIISEMIAIQKEISEKKK
jgi:signal peptidase